MGRPRNDDKVQPTGESEIVNEVREDLKSRVKIVSVADYIQKARELFGPDKIWENAVCLLYGENEVIAILDKKGEQKFVCKHEG